MFSTLLARSCALYVLSMPCSYLLLYWFVELLIGLVFVSLSAQASGNDFLVIYTIYTYTSIYTYIYNINTYYIPIYLCI